MSRNLLLIASAAAVIAGGAVAADVASAKPQGGPCFYSHEWRGWSAPTPDTLYLRVGLRDIYRVDLTPGSHVRRGVGDHLVNRVHGNSTICSPLDLNLAVRDTQGFERGIIARSLRRLGPDEIAAIPRKDLP